MSKDNHDPYDKVDEAIAAYLDHIKENAPAPDLSDLTPDERALVEQIADSVRVGQGMDPSQSRPSIEALFARLEKTQDVSALNARPGLGAVHQTLVDALDPDCVVLPDIVAEAEHLASDLLVIADGTRIRVSFRADIADDRGLLTLDPRSIAGPILGRFRDTEALIVVAADHDLTSVAIDPYMIHDTIVTPNGTHRRPAVTGPALPLEMTLRSYLDAVGADLSFVPVEQWAAVDVDPSSIISNAASSAVAKIREAGERARTPAKTAEWSAFGDRETAQIEVLIRDAENGQLRPEDLERRIEAAA